MDNYTHNAPKEKWFVNKVISLFFHLEIDSYLKLTLLCLCHHADKQGFCYPLTENIAIFVGISDRQFRRLKLLQQLKDLKFITIKRKYFKEFGMTRYTYTIHLDAIEEMALRNGSLTLTLDQELIEIPVDNTGQSLNQRPLVSADQDLNQRTSVSGLSGGSADISSPLTSYKTTQAKAEIKLPQRDIVHVQQKMNSLPLPLFDKFWAAYPRKENRSRALLVWQRRNLDDKADLIIADIEKRTKNHVQWKSKEFIPHATSYLNGERWNDEIIEDVPLTSTHKQPQQYQPKQDRITRQAETIRKEISDYAAKYGK